MSRAPRALVLVAAGALAGLALVAWAGGLFSAGEDRAAGSELPFERDASPDAQPEDAPLRGAPAGDGRDARREALAELRTQARNIDGAWALIGRLERATDEQTALRLGRVLRDAKQEEVARALAARAVDAPSALTRLAAVVALELRAPEVWFEAVQGAYLADADARVRTEAARLLGRALQDRAQAAVHAQARDTLVKGLESPDADQRLRSLTALMVDPRPRPGDLEAVRARLEDGDPRVQREARATLRLLEGRAAR